MPLDMTKLDPPPTTAQLTAKEQLELYVAQAQFRLSMVSMGIYFVILAIFLAVLQWISKDNQLTLAVLLLQPLTLLIGNLASFWLQRTRPQQTEQQGLPTVTTSATPTGSTTTVTPPATAAQSAVASVTPPPVQPGAA